MATNDGDDYCSLSRAISLLLVMGTSEAREAAARLQLVIASGVLEKKPCPNCAGTGWVK